MMPDHDAWMVNLDLDEVLKPDWREHWKNIPDEANRLRYRYIWNWKADGVPGVEYHGDKLVRRHTHHWENKVHEVNVPNEGVTEIQHFLPNFEIWHFADNTKSRSNYLPLLIEDVEENPNNDRNTYYCARELFFYGRFEESIKLFKRHLTMPESVWAPERAWSMRYLARMLPQEAEQWHLRACAEYPTGAETWTDLAKYYHEKKDWVGMYDAAKRALQCQLYKGLYLTEPDAYGWWPNDMAALAAYHLGLKQEAFMHGVRAVGFNPEDQRLQENLLWYKRSTFGVTVVIPTKSNINGLMSLINVLLNSAGVSKIIVVGDGTETEPMLRNLPPDVIKTYVPRNSGIHAMWNAGMQMADINQHVLFLNDDVTINPTTVFNLSDAFNKDPQLGLICPKYAGDSETDVQVYDTCRGRYDGTGGMAGFAMMLCHDLIPFFRFNEHMKWWYGDDLLVDWVNKIAQRKCTIIAAATCKHAHSVTVDKDPPLDFGLTVQKDKALYEQLTKGFDQALPLDAELHFSQLATFTNRGAGDIAEHLVTLRNLANQCEHVTEFGARWGISTSALICGQPDKFISYDINKGFFEPYQSEVEALAQKAGVNFQFVEGDVLGVSIEETDLLFIDTHHTYNQLTSELKKHSSKVKRFIVLHDTVTYARKDEPPYEVGVVSSELEGSQNALEGLWTALETFLGANTDWRIAAHYENNNGLTVLERIK